MAKKRHIIRNSIKSFFEAHTDPAEHEKLQSTRKDMEEKRNQILNIVRSEEDKDESRKGSLTELIEDFYKQYESLYAQYDHLTGELKSKVDKHHHENGNSSSSSDSDSGSDSDHSPKKEGSKNGKREDDFLKATDGLHKELEATKLEVSLLKNKLEDVSNEKESLESTYDAIMSKLESTEKTVEGLKVENETLNSEKSTLLIEKEDLKEGSIKTEVDLKQQIEELIREKNILAIEKEDGKNLKATTSEKIKALEEQNDRLKLELDTVMREKREIEEQFESTGTESRKMTEEVSELRSQISQMDILLKERESRLISLQNKVDVDESESTSKIEALTAKVNEFTLEVDKLHAEKSQLEERVKEQEEKLKHKSEEHELLEGRLRDLSMTAESKDGSVAELKRTIKDLKKDLELAEEEAKTTLDKTRTTEFQLLMVNQKLRITEQLLAEKEDDYKIADRRFREERKIVEDEIRRLTVSILANNKAYRGVIVNISENVNTSVAEMESITKKFEEDNGKFSSRIYSMSEEIQILKHYVAGKNIERENLEEKLRILTEELQNEKEHAVMVKQNLSKLEVEAEKQKEENKKLKAEFNGVNKTTEELVIILEDEKREAIRQLCLWSDNLQSRYNELKKTVTKSSSPRPSSR